jgi:cyclopropane fatty-acyl-phospholipid synthase-like methyltransferase
MNEDVNVVCDDGRNFIARDKNTYDIILVDAYSSISAPFHMTTVEFFTLVKDHLNDDGIMMMNVNMYSDKKESFSVAVCDTACSVFDNLYEYRVNNASGLEVYASKNKEMPLIENVKNVAVSDWDLQKVFNRLGDNLKPYEDSGVRLYDETCDVEMRSMYTLDDMVQMELQYYRDIYKESGLKGLFEELLG